LTRHIGRYNSTTMIFKDSSGKWHLAIFEDMNGGISIDRELPKWKKFVEDRNSMDKDAPTSSGEIVMRPVFNQIEGNGFTNQTSAFQRFNAVDSLGIINYQPHKRSLFSVIKSAILYWREENDYGKQAKAVKEVDVVPKYDAQQLFHIIKSGLVDLKKYDNKVKLIQEMIEKAKIAGQTSLKETYENQRDVAEFEARLFASNNVKYLDESDVASFVAESEKGLRLDYIKNFHREIPYDIIKKKLLVDELMAFDNYVILHYDPSVTAFKHTKQEEAEILAKKKDPILFGVINGSTKLYFVGDWIDEVCNLTFDELIKTFEGKNIKSELK